MHTACWTFSVKFASRANKTEQTYISCTHSPTQRSTINAKDNEAQVKVHVSTCNEGIEEEWKWRWKGSFKLRRLYRRGKNTRHTLNRMGGSQRRYGRFGENGHAWNQTHRLARSVVTIYHHSDKIWVFYEERSQNCEKRLLASSCLSVCMAVRMEQLGSHKSLCLPIFFFRKSVDKIRIL